RAQAAFLDLAVSAQDQALGLDSAKDLAFILARSVDEEKVLSIFEEKLSKTGERGRAFLKKALSAFEAQGTLGAQSRLRNRVFELETSNDAKASILLESLQGVSKEYASLAHAQRILEVLGVAQSIPETQKAVLESASEKVCRIFSETYSDKLKTPEKLTKPLLAGTLRKLFDSHLRVFPNSKRKTPLVKTWLDICELEKDAECLVQVSDRFLSENQKGEKVSPVLRARALDARILGLELLVAGPNSVQYRQRFIHELELKLADPNSKDGPIAGAKLAQIQIDEKDFKSARKTLEIVFKRQPTQEYWYRLKWVQLQEKDHSAVLSGPEVYGVQKIEGTPDTRLQSVIAEAALGLAEASRKAGDLTGMGKSIRRFESSSNDVAKVNVARDEWVAALFEKKAALAALQAIESFPGSWHARPEADSWKLALLSHFMESGEHASAQKVLKIWPENQRKKIDLQLELMIALFFSGARAVNYEQVRKLTDAQRSIWLSTGVLTQPGWVFNYFTRYPVSSPDEGALSGLAHRLLGKEDPLDPELKERARIQKKTPFEISISKIALPSSSSATKKSSLQKYTQSLQKGIAQIKIKREEMVASLKGQPAEVQIRIIMAQRALENAVAQAILQSPVPASLQSAELEQYQKGLQELAQEYQDQVKELEAAATKIEAKLQESKSEKLNQERSRTLPVLSKPDSLVPSKFLKSDSPLNSVFQMARSANAWGALIELERLHALKKIEGLDYRRIRAWVLASKEGSEGARTQNFFLLRYLYDELSDSEAKVVISEWKELAR
ncbi:MAG: hypothetical protein KGQ59_04750, partial [Bdellovibrionales bacterium]|nr:hypothetical protein [Bdellovibrionales bacterium]